MMFVSLDIHTTDVTSRTRTANPSGAPEITPVFSGSRVVQSFVLYVVVRGSFLSLFHLAFVYLSFFDLRLLITPFVSLNFLG